MKQASFRRRFRQNDGRPHADDRHVLAFRGSRDAPAVGVGVVVGVVVEVEGEGE